MFKLKVKSRRIVAARLLFFLVEVAAVILFASGLQSTLRFLITESRAELTRRPSVKIPKECEAAFNNHGGYTCWYTIYDHPFWFALSLAAVVAGGGIIVWAQSRWFPRRKMEA
jgi:hypothetical protein